MKNLKIKSAEFNNRKRQISVTYNSGKTVDVHYGSLGIEDNVKEVWIDGETGGKSLGIMFADGKTDYMPFDQPLAIVKDPDFVFQTHIEIITSRIRDVIKKQKISKRYLAEQLGTSDNQIQRLLNPQILNKNFEQLYKIASLIDLEFEIRLKKAA